jgi:hypothetical protein
VGVSVNVDTSLWVYDFVAMQWARFYLYNPTFSQNVRSGGVQYADAVEFDYSGEYILYDAFNSITNTSGANIEYWDVGFIRVWDNVANTWGDGEVTKLFSELEPGENLGNAVFSSNSPYVIAFDFFNNNNNSYTILGANIETGDLDTIFQQTLLGYPDYSRLDDKVVFSALSTMGAEIIGQIDVQNNKIRGVPSTATGLFSDARWPVWFAQGNRSLNVGVEELVIAENKFVVYPNPFNNELSVRYELETAAPVSIAMYNMMGQQVKNLASQTNQPKGSYEIKSSMSDLPVGSYFVRLTAGDSFKTLKVVKF